MSVIFELPGGTIVCPSLQMALQTIRHGDLNEYPGIVEVPKMDTPTGLFAGCCTCSWRSDGLESEKGAWASARAHVKDKHS